MLLSILYYQTHARPKSLPSVKCSLVALIIGINLAGGGGGGAAAEGTDEGAVAPRC